MFHRFLAFPSFLRFFFLSFSSSIPSDSSLLLGARPGKYRRKGEAGRESPITIERRKGDAIISRADRRGIVVRGKGTIESIIEPPARD